MLVRVTMVCALIATVPGIAADDTITTDRPDFVESSNTVGKGVFQLETSAAFESVNEGPFDITTFTTPTLFRYGFADNWEARLETDGPVRVRISDELFGGAVTDEGFSDVAVGVKQHVFDGEPGTARPSVGWLLHADLDVGSRAFRGDGIRPSLRASAEWDLTDLLSLGVMPGIIHDTDGNGDRFTGGIFAAVLGEGWTERFGTFIEIAAEQIASESHGGDVITLSAGGTLLLNDDLQLDTAFSSGLNDNSPDFAVTFGVSARFGNLGGGARAAVPSDAGSAGTRFRPAR